MRGFSYPFTARYLASSKRLGNTALLESSGVNLIKPFWPNYIKIDGAKLIVAMIYINIVVIKAKVVYRIDSRIPIKIS